MISIIRKVTGWGVAILIILTSFSNAETLSFYEPSYGMVMKVDLDVLSKGNSKEAYDIFFKVWRSRDLPNLKDIVRRSGEALAKNKAVQTMLEEQFEPVTKGFQTPMDDLEILGGIPAPWSMRLLGRHLTNSTPMYPQEAGSDVGRTSNQRAAMYALSRMGFWDAPTPGKDPELEMTWEKEAEWKQWWKANESRIDERVLEINPNYFGDAAPASVAKSPTPETTSFPEETRISASSRLFQPAETASVKEKNFPIVSVILVLALAVGGLVFYLTRKR
jgi:hypothetical protein